MPKPKKKKKNAYETHAWVEFRAAGWLDDKGEFKDPMQKAMCEHVLKLLKVFSDEGYSGTSAMYAIGLFRSLAKFETIAPLTGAADEWNEIGPDEWQNRRLSSVFKERLPDGTFNVYDIDGIIWYDEMKHEDGTTFKRFYTNRDSRVPVVFPYTQQRVEKPRPEEAE